MNKRHKSKHVNVLNHPLTTWIHSGSVTAYWFWAGLVQTVWFVLPERAPRSLSSTLERNPEVSLWERNLGRGHSRGKCLISPWVSPSSSMVASSVIRRRIAHSQWQEDDRATSLEARQHQQHLPPPVSLELKVFFFSRQTCVWLTVCRRPSPLTDRFPIKWRDEMWPDD